MNQTLNAIHVFLNSKNTPINEASIQELIITSLNDLCMNKKYENIDSFISILLTQKINESTKDKLFDVLVNILIMNKKEKAYQLFNKLFPSLNITQFKNILKYDTKHCLAMPTLRNTAKHISGTTKNEKLDLMEIICEDLGFITKEFTVLQLIEIFQRDFLLETDLDRKENDLLYNQAFSKLLYTILRYIVNKRMSSDDAALKIVELVNIISNYVGDKQYIVGCISLFIEINYWEFIKTKKTLFVVHENINNILLEAINAISINACMKYYKNIIIYAKYDKQMLQGLLRKLVILYCEDGGSHFYPLMVTILHHLGFEYLNHLIMSCGVNIINFKAVLKDVCNVDLCMFLDVFAELPKGDAFMAFPGFMKFCTDRKGNIEMLMQIIKKEVNKQCITHKFNESTRYICQGLHNLIETQLKVMNERIILENEVTMIETQHIFEVLNRSGILSKLISIYMNHALPDLQLAIESLLKIGNSEILQNDMKLVFNYLCNYNESDDITLNLSEALPPCTTFPQLIALARVFIPYLNKDATLTLKILSLLNTRNNQNQKLCYSLLYGMARMDKIGICICDTLISTDYQMVFTCTLKYRLMTLFTCFEKCLTCQKGNKNFFQRIMFELLNSLKSNSYKARRSGRDILEANINNENYKDFLKILIAGLNTHDYRIINGAIAGLVFFIQKFKDHVLKNIDLITSQAIGLKNKGKECHKSIIELYKTLLIEIKGIDKEVFISLIDMYVHRKNLHQFLKDLIYELRENKIELSVEMKKLLKTKFKKQDVGEAVITKKGQIELIGAKIEDYDSSD